MTSNDEPLTEVNLVRWIKLVATICLLIPATPSRSESGADELPAAQDLPAVTQAHRVLTAREAYAKWQAESRKPIILDVRTAEEFLFVGHAEMAWNVPVAAQSYVWDSATVQFPMRPLPDFVSRVEQIAEHSDTLLVMCRSGGRIARAAELLTRTGFSNVYNISDGMEGRRLCPNAGRSRSPELGSNAQMIRLFALGCCWAESLERSRPLAVCRDF
jgi:rhodanese-related sulfurtransferase